MENIDLSELLEFNEEKQTITISNADPILFHGILTSLVMANIDAVKESIGGAIGNTLAFSTLKMIANKYQEAYEDLQRLEVPNDQIN